MAERYVAKINSMNGDEIIDYSKDQLKTYQKFFTEQMRSGAKTPKHILTVCAGLIITHATAASAIGDCFRGFSDDPDAKKEVARMLFDAIGGIEKELARNVSIDTKETEKMVDIHKLMTPEERKEYTEQIQDALRQAKAMARSENPVIAGYGEYQKHLCGPLSIIFARSYNQHNGAIALSALTTFFLNSFMGLVLQIVQDREHFIETMNQFRSMVNDIENTVLSNFDEERRNAR